MTIVYVVIIPHAGGGIKMILAAYVNEVHAETHARTVTGARVLPLSAHNQLLDSVTDDIASDDWDGDDDITPVMEPVSDTTKTQPSTPRAKSKRKPPA